MFGGKIVGNGVNNVWGSCDSWCWGLFVIMGDWGGKFCMFFGEVEGIYWWGLLGIFISERNYVVCVNVIGIKYRWNWELKRK